jgi:hypothetical protein
MAREVMHNLTATGRMTDVHAVLLRYARLPTATGATR